MAEQLKEQSEQPTAVKSPRRLSRRQFLALSAVAGVAGTSLVIGITLYNKRGAALKPSTKPLAPNLWVRIDPDNTVTVRVAKSEMGQGVLTALPMLLIEELDADWSKVRVEQAPADSQYGTQLTDGSSSVSGLFFTLRQAGAEARALLVEAAAEQWGVDPSTCRTDKGVVLHPASGQRLAYGALTEVASALGKPAPASLKLKKSAQFSLIGTRAPRLDTPAKIDGSAQFGLDVRVPGLRYATLARPPVPGASLQHVNSASASAVPGVLQVIQVPSGVAVVAETTWAAIRGRAALELTWDEGQNAGLSSAIVHEQLAAQVQKLVAANNQAASADAQTIQATYETPYQAHATLEPMNCTAWVQADRCEVWAPTQDPGGAQIAASSASGLLANQVMVHVTLMGGGFGRRAQSDFVSEAVQVSKAIGQPVQVVWTRQDDLQHDFYRPATLHQLSATLDGAGHIQAWTHVVAAQHMANQVMLGAELPYSIPSKNLNGSDVSLAVPVGIWRAVEFSYNTFVVESFLDEVAAAAGQDPYQLRLQLLDGNPRLKAALMLAATKAGWGTPLPDGWGRGIACAVFSISNTAVAEVAEVSVEGDGKVRVQRVVCGVDCGLVVNPAIAEAQLEGAIVYGLTAALKGEITFANGRVQQQTFADYPLLRMDEMPSVEVYFVPGGTAPAGLGEPGLPPIAPAVANAIYAATGKRLRRLPMRPADLR
ncbi:MAG TPA: xanthine dehydrogenase family protein molybdopterin-binding subunit [Ktedonobacterales bacterium]|jgi:isoquinoline 1-oxidoreductase beta subunit